MGPVSTPEGNMRKRGVGGGDWGQDSDFICLSLALLVRRENADLRARNLVKSPEAPSELGHLANASLKDFTNPWRQMKPRARLREFPV